VSLDNRGPHKGSAMTCQGGLVMGPPPELLQLWANLLLVARWADAVGKLHGGVRGDVLLHRLPGVLRIADTLAGGTNR
jgi:hypothetical protein